MGALSLNKYTMYSTALAKALDTKTILSIVSEYDIFKYYIGQDLVIGRSINSPLRKDETPSFIVYKTQYGVYSLRFMDHSTGQRGTCFDLVMMLYSCDFTTSLRLIDRDLHLGIAACKIDSTIRSRTMEALEVSHELCSIEVGIRDWDIVRDKGYWTSFGITGRTLQKYNVYPLSHYRVNGHEYEFKDLCYGYYFGNEMWKLYRPFHTTGKWFSNTNSSVIQGSDQLPAKGDLLVITKSLKDIMVYHEIGVTAIAPQSESILIKEDYIMMLKSRFSRIIVNFDFDYAGVRGGQRYKKRYGLMCKYFTNGRLGTVDFKVKDAAEFVHANSAGQLQELIKTIL